MFFAEAFVVCEDYSPPEGFSEKDLYRLLKEVGSPSGADDLGKQFLLVSLDLLVFVEQVICLDAATL